ncbi:MAG: tetratricopeptide repeat protein [Betaproteobacteria bacterium]
MRCKFSRRWGGALLALLALAPVVAGSPGVAAKRGTGLERSLLYLQMGLPEMALHELEKSAAEGTVEVLVFEGLLREAMGQPERAAAVLAEAAHVAPPDPAALGPAVIRALQARLLADGGRLNEALGLYREALAADASLGLARRGLAEGLARLGRNEEAIEEYRRFLADNPEDCQALVAVGQLYLAVGRLEEAKTSFALALRLDPGYPGVAETLRRLKGTDAGASQRPQETG